MNHIRTIAAAALGAAALAAAGCGAGAHQPDGAPRADVPRTSGQRAFLKAGNDLLCHERHAFVGDVLGQVLHGEPTPEEMRAAFLPGYRAIHDGLAGMTPPAGDEPQVAAILSALQDAIDVADRDPSRLDSDEDPFGPVEKIMAGYGLDGCA